MNGCYSSRCPSGSQTLCANRPFEDCQVRMFVSRANCQVRMFLKQLNRRLQHLLAVENKTILQQLKPPTLYKAFVNECQCDVDKK